MCDGFLMNEAMKYDSHMKRGNWNQWRFLWNDMHRAILSVKIET